MKTRFVVLTIFLAVGLLCQSSKACIAPDENPVRLSSNVQITTEGNRKIELEGEKIQPQIVTAIEIGSNRSVKFKINSIVTKVKPSSLSDRIRGRKSQYITVVMPLLVSLQLDESEYSRLPMKVEIRTEERGNEHSVLLVLAKPGPHLKGGCSSKIEVKRI